MAQVEITVNGRGYTVGCDDGQESHVAKLGKYLDQKVAGLVNNMGQIGDTRLAVMAGLIIADELSDSEQRAAARPQASPAPNIDRVPQELPPADRDKADRIAGGRGGSAAAASEGSVDAALLADHLEQLAVRIEKIALALEEA